MTPRRLVYAGATLLANGFLLLGGEPVHLVAAGLLCAATARLEVLL